MPKPTSIHPDIVHVCRTRLGRAVEQIHTDLDLLPRPAPEKGDRCAPFPIAGVAMFALFDGEQVDACMTINGRRDQVMHLLGRILVNSSISPIELLPFWAEANAEAKAEAKAREEQQQGKN